MFCSLYTGNLSNAINQCDILMTVGVRDSCEKIVKKCLGKEVPEEGDERLRLDLERYKSMHQGRLKEMYEHDFGVEACENLKQLTFQYGEVIDSVMQQINNKPSPLPNTKARFIDWSGKRRACKVGFKFPVAELNEQTRLEHVGVCPVCLSSISWLPKYATYRLCNYKVIPEIDWDQSAGTKKKGIP